MSVGSQSEVRRYFLCQHRDTISLNCLTFKSGLYSILLCDGTLVCQHVPSVFLCPWQISSVGRALDCRAGGRRFDFSGRTNTWGLKQEYN